MFFGHYCSDIVVVWYLLWFLINYICTWIAVLTEMKNRLKHDIPTPCLVLWVNVAYLPLVPLAKTNHYLSLLLQQPFDDSSDGSSHEGLRKTWRIFWRPPSLSRTFEKNFIFLFISLFCSSFWALHLNMLWNLASWRSVSSFISFQLATTLMMRCFVSSMIDYFLYLKE